MKSAGVLIAISFRFMAMRVSALLLTQRRACAIFVNERYDKHSMFPAYSGPSGRRRHAVKAAAMQKWITL